MRGNYALVALSVFLGACGPFCAGALAFSPGAWRMARRARARSRSCASAVGRRWIKGAVNERAPEDCGALRYYKRSLVKQMRREGKGWWVLKRLGGEIEVSNPRKRVKLAPAAASASGLTAAEENEFHAFLVDRFNQCVQLSGSLRESSGRLQYDAGLGDFGDAAQWYSDMLIYDNSIDSMKAELNRKILVAERSRYRNFWSEIQYMVNDLGTMSAALVNQWGIAKQSGSASAVDTSATYASYRAHEDRARSLA